ncbi:RNA binding Pelota-like protein [Rhizobium sp. PP-F2F-G20b]|nr:RNA binding Pelota-like protein [Rhizobium sp. PP-F2F-G20b]
MATSYNEPFSGSYDPADVQFLLKKVSMSPTDVFEKEVSIQSGTRHYSEMISTERPPAESYMRIFNEALAAGAERMGKEIVSLACAIDSSVTGPITLASLVRAGVPVGVLLNRALSFLGRDVAHFGVSIIRDRGIDRNAMRYILDRRPIEGLLFVDGWTGKGAISSELERAFEAYSTEKPKLVVLADPAGRSWLAASGDDWLIPSGILGSTVSGLISRSILNADVVGRDDFHACVHWKALEPQDISTAFVDDVWRYCEAAFLHRAVDPSNNPLAVWTDGDRQRHGVASRRAIDFVRLRNNVGDENRIKPGIAEATRAILRRIPEMVFISSEEDVAVSALMHLVRERNIPYSVVSDAIDPYRAVTLIRQVL